MSNNPRDFLHDQRRFWIGVTAAACAHFAVLVFFQLHQVTPKEPKATQMPSVSVHFAQAQPTTRQAMVYSGKGAHRVQSQQTKTLTAHSSDVIEKSYYDRWQTYIEGVGNRWYAKQPYHAQLEGNLTLLVAIQKNGALKEVKILKSSGSKKLDTFAMQIVQNAAPFEPIPQEMQDTNQIQIIRAWQFNQGAPASDRYA